MTSSIPITTEGFRRGVRMCLPYVPGYFIMGAAVGTFAAQKGLSLVETILMNAFVCAAAALSARGGAKTEGTAVILFRR